MPSFSRLGDGHRVAVDVGKLLLDLRRIGHQQDVLHMARCLVQRVLDRMHQHGLGVAVLVFQFNVCAQLMRWVSATVVSASSWAAWRRAK